MSDGEYVGLLLEFLRDIEAYILWFLDSYFLENTRIQLLGDPYQSLI